MGFRHILAGLATFAAAALGTAAHAQNTQPGGYYGLYAAEPRYGSPNSMEFQVASSSLDLFSVQPEGEDAFTPEGDSDTVGGAFTYWKAGAQKGERYDLHYQHARRLGEGTRARLLIDVPVNIDHANAETITFAPGITAPIGGATAVYGTINAGVELPVMPNWLVTPRVAYSNLQAGPYFAHDAELASLSLTSRYKLAQVGRGDLVIGNMVAWSHTVDTFLSKQPFFDRSDFWTLRNGIAYQLPLKSRMFGRQSSLRASYVFTYNTGEPGLAYKYLHEVGVNIGVRTREAEQKNRFEQMRVGLLYTHGKNQFASDSGYDAVTLTLGYRF